MILNQYGNTRKVEKILWIHVILRVHVINVTYHLIVDVNLDHLAEVVFSRFLQCKAALLFPFPCCTLWKEVYAEPTLKKWGVMSPSLRVKYRYKLFRILLRRFVSSPPFIHSFIHLVIYLYQHGLNSCFILLIIIQYHIIYFVPQIVPALVSGSSFNWLLCFFDMHPSLCSV